MRRLLVTCTLLLSAWLAQAQPAAGTPWPTREWTRATPASQGLDPGVLAELVDELARPGAQTDSVLLVRHGRLVLEVYGAPFRAGLRHDLRSVTKTVTATVLAAAVQEGRIASDQEKVLRYFPERTPSSHGQQALTIRHLLDMRAGIDWREWPYDAQSDAVTMLRTADLTDFILARQVQAPGQRFHYMGAAPHLLSAIVTRSTGRNAADYARRDLFRSLGIEDFAWPADARGDSVGDARLRLRPLDLARIGLLYLRGGQWEGRQLLPPGWTESLFVGQGPRHGIPSRILPPTYRNLWWTDARFPYATANGRHGQFMVLLPRHDLLLVITAKMPDDGDGVNPPALVNRYLLRAVKGDAALPSSPRAEARLHRALERLARREAPASRKPTPAVLAQARRTYVLEPGSAGYREFSLDLDAPAASYRVVPADAAQAGSGSLGGPIGMAGRFIESTRPGDLLWARRGRWLDERTFLIEAQHLEDAYVTEWTARFREDGTLELRLSNGEGEVLTLRGRARQPATAAVEPPQPSRALHALSP